MPDIEQARQWYPKKDAVHGFDHVLRVLSVAERLAQAEGADLEIVRAAALLHDVDSSQLSAASRAAHQLASAEFARQVLAGEGWSEARIAAVQHAIRAHRFRDEREMPQSLEAQILFDADKLDAIGATGIGRAIAYAVQAGSPLYAHPSATFLDTGRTEPGELHSAYHEYLFKLRKLKDRLYTRSGRLLAERRHNLLQTYFEQLHLEMEGQA